eukprot:6200055-Pleurochrysis_carterae.AAC.5
MRAAEAIAGAARVHVTGQLVLLYLITVCSRDVSAAVCKFVRLFVLRIRRFLQAYCKRKQGFACFLNGQTHSKFAYTSASTFTCACASLQAASTFPALVRSASDFSMHMRFNVEQSRLSSAFAYVCTNVRCRGMGLACSRGRRFRGRRFRARRFRGRRFRARRFRGRRFRGKRFLAHLCARAEYLIGRGYTFERIDGNVTSLERQHRIDRFNREAKQKAAAAAAGRGDLVDGSDGAHAGARARAQCRRGLVAQTSTPTVSPGGAISAPSLGWAPCVKGGTLASRQQYLLRLGRVVEYGERTS